MEEEFDLFGNKIVKDVLLRDRFLEPPFSVLDTRGGEWQERKQAWQGVGIQSELGRDAGCMPEWSKGELDEKGLDKYGRKPMTHISIFDPALTELMYRWFCPDGGTILDPFAGGSVRGIVANYLGFKYTGLELREEQVTSNRQQALNILPLERQPIWHIGDSDKTLDTLEEKFDFIFSCPPYFDLEVYSDLPDDISNMDYPGFIAKYRSIIAKAVTRLKPGGFACFVVGDIRDKKGFYRDFVGDTRRAFVEAGAGFYNDAVLVNSVGTACLRAAKVFEAGKKLTKIHQNVLVFKKG